MGKRQFEQILGMHCAPTFIGLKAASLVSFPKKSFSNFDDFFSQYESCFRCKRISTFQLAETDAYVLVLFYRAAALKQLLRRSDARKLLLDVGYPPHGSLADLMHCLKERVRKAQGFPHEIGLFLGYPPTDVRGFIEHKGHNFLCCGYWKVYGDEGTAQALFDLYANCTKDFCRKLQEGTPMEKLLQAV